MSEREATRWRSDAMSLGFALASGMSAMVTFGAAYGGRHYLVVGAVALFIGTAVAYGGTLLRQPYWLVIGEGVAAYFLFGAAVVASSSAVDRFLPGASSTAVLGRTAISGWAGLLSTEPVVGNAQNLLVVPFFCGVACGLATTMLALRARRYLLAVLPPLSLLVIGILFGTDSDATRLVPGGLLAILVLAWVAYTQRGRRRTDIGSDSKLRPVFGGGILVACGLAGVAAAPQLPLASSHLRYVLRDHIAPPFNIDRYVSPLSQYRNYVLPDGLRNKALFVVKGAPANTYLQIATMDAYNGVVFNVAEGSAGSSASGNFATVGQPVSNQSCPTRTVCRMRTIRIHVIRYQGVWMPSVGIVRSVSFSGSSMNSLGDAFRYNVSTNSAVISTGLTSGDTYSIDTDLSTFPPQAKLVGARIVQSLQPAPNDVPSIVHRIAVKLTAGASSDFSKAQDLAQGLSTGGAFSDGYDKQQPSLAGHGAFRIAQFLSLPQPVGDSEQYAATMALMARSLGLPARVVLGVDLAKGGTVTVHGKDVTAWVDIDFQGIGWYPFNPTPPISARVDVKNPPPTPNGPNQAQYQPPAHSLTSQASSSPNAIGKGHGNRPHHSTLASTLIEVAQILAITLLAGVVLIGPALLIRFLKGRRRSQRRKVKNTRDQVAGGWAELLDCARDLGRRVPRYATRREQAPFLGDTASFLAALANSATFGPSDPPSATVERFWTMVDESIRQMYAGLSFWHRVRARLNLASLRPETTTFQRISDSLAHR